MNECKIDVSIVTCFYNAERYISSYIESVEKQSGLRFEVIMVNDGSNDNSEKILKAYLRDRKIDIKYIKQENAGQGPARNKGLSFAQGEFIYYLDIDDNIEEGALEKLVRIARAKKVDIVTFNSINMDVDFSTVLESPYKKRRINEGSYYSDDFLIKSLMGGAFYIPVWLCLFKRSFLISANINFLPIIHEDCIYAIHIYLEANSVYYYNAILHKRRIVENSITHMKISERRIEDTFRVMYDAENLYNMLDNPKLKKAMKKWNIICSTLAISTIRYSDYSSKYRMRMLRYIWGHRYMIGIKGIIKLALLFVKKDVE